MPPVTTRAQKLEALGKANTIRTGMAGYKARVKTGEQDVYDAIDSCPYPVTVGQLLCSYPRIGLRKAAEVQRAAGLVSLDLYVGNGYRAARHTRMLTDNERERLKNAVQTVIGHLLPTRQQVAA